MSVLLWQGIWLGSGGAQGLSAPEQAPAAGLDIMGLQGIWLGGFPKQARGNVNFEETLTFGMAAGLQNSLSLTISEQIGLQLRQGFDIFETGRIFEETLTFGSLMGAPFSEIFTIGETLVFGQLTGLRETVEGGCGPYEVWEDLSSNPDEVWRKGPC